MPITTRTRTVDCVIRKTDSKARQLQASLQPNEEIIVVDISRNIPLDDLIDGFSYATIPTDDGVLRMYLKDIDKSRVTVWRFYFVSQPDFNQPVTQSLKPNRPV